MSLHVCECVYSFPREVLAERYLFTPLAELMELSSSDRLQERRVECWGRRLVQTQEGRKKKKCVYTPEKLLPGCVIQTLAEGRFTAVDERALEIEKKKTCWLCETGITRSLCKSPRLFFCL